MDTATYIQIFERISMGIVSRAEGVAELVRAGSDEPSALEDVAIEYGSRGDVIDLAEPKPKPVAPILRRRFLGLITDEQTLRALADRCTPEQARKLMARQDALKAQNTESGGTP
jgi:hypothetical protein